MRKWLIVLLLLGMTVLPVSAMDFTAPSAPESAQKYMPQEETKLDELKRLDRTVQNSGVMEALIVGVVGCLIFGVGMCFGLGVFGTVTWPAVIFGLIGTVGMIFAYPVNRKCYNKAKNVHLPRILELAAELSGQVS